MADAAATFVADEDGRILMLKRGATAPWMPNRWNLPGGHVDPGETPLQAAVREADEETGLTISNLTPMGTQREPWGTLHLFFSASWAGTPEKNWESSELLWMTPQEALKSNLVPGLASAFQEMARQTSEKPIQKNPIPARDERFILDPNPWIGDTVLDDYTSPEDAGFFHVTTNRAKVLTDERLRSRADVGIVGLGGGRNDPGRHISFVISIDRARWLYKAIKGLRLAMLDGTAVEALELALDWTRFPEDWVLDAHDNPEGVEDDLNQMCTEMGLDVSGEFICWTELLREQGHSLNTRWNTPHLRYELVQFFEARLLSTFYVPDHWNDGTCIPTVGFTASAAEFERVVPEQISIVQAAIRLGAETEIIDMECELRFRPEDVQIVAVDCQNEGVAIPVPGPD